MSDVSLRCAPPPPSKAQQQPGAGGPRRHPGLPPPLLRRPALRSRELARDARPRLRCLLLLHDDDVPARRARAGRPGAPRHAAVARVQAGLVQAGRQRGRFWSLGPLRLGVEASGASRLRGARRCCGGEDGGGLSVLYRVVWAMWWAAV